LIIADQTDFALYQGRARSIKITITRLLRTLEE
jgi:hypothetical protein